MAACGQMSAHLLHWMQGPVSQTGISSAMARFSQRVVPVGQVPSTGKADTGKRSPLLASMRAVTRLTKSGAPSGTTGDRGLPVTLAGTFTSWRWARVASTASKFFCTTSGPLRP
jgi:hypothetical protein